MKSARTVLAAMVGLFILVGNAAMGVGLPENPIIVSGGDSATVNGGVVEVTPDGNATVFVPTEELVASELQSAVGTAGDAYAIRIDGTVIGVGYDAVRAEGNGNIIWHEGLNTIIAAPDSAGAYGAGIVSGDAAEVYNSGSIDAFDETYGPYQMPTGDPDTPFVDAYGLGGAGIVVGDNSRVENYGSIEAGESGIVAGAGSDILNAEGADIRSDLNGTGFAPFCAIAVGDGSNVTNVGSLDSANSAGIRAGDGALVDGERVNVIDNTATGTIDAYLAGIQAGDNYTITNAGRITGGYGIFAGDNNLIVNAGNGDWNPDEGDATIEADAIGILLQIDPTNIDLGNIEQSILVNLLDSVDPTLVGNSVTNHGFVLGNGAGIVGVANNTIDNHGISVGSITGIGGLEGNVINNDGLIYGDLTGVIVRNNANLVTNEGLILGSIGIVSDVGNTLINRGSIGWTEEIGLLAGLGIAAFDGNVIDNFGTINAAGVGIFVAPQSPIGAAFAAAGEELDAMGLTLPAYLEDYTPTGNVITNGDLEAEVQIPAERGTIRVLGGAPDEGGLASYGILIDSRGEYFGTMVSDLFGIDYAPTTYREMVEARNSDEDPANDFVIGRDFLNRITNNGLISSFGPDYFDEGLGQWIADPYFGGGIHAGDFSDVTNNGEIFVTETGIAGYDGNRIVNNGEIRSDYQEPAVINCGIHVENDNVIENNGLIVSYTSDGIVAGDGNTIVNNFGGRIYADDSGIVAGMGNTVHNMAGGLIVAGNMDGIGAMTGISVGNSDEPIILLAENSYSTVRGVTDEQFIRDNIFNRVINDGQILGVGTGIAAGSHAEVTNAALHVYTLAGESEFDWFTFWDGVIEGGQTGIAADSYNLITNHGYIHSDFEPSFSTGIHVGYENLVTNYGTIWSETSIGISADFHNTIINEGTIFAETVGISGVEYNRIVNHGLIDNGMVTPCYALDCSEFQIDDTEELALVGIQVGHDNDIINTATGTINAADHGILAGANNTVTNSGTITAVSGAAVKVVDDDGYTFGENGFDGTANVVTNTATGTIRGHIGIQMDGAGAIDIEGGLVESTGEAAIIIDSDGNFSDQFVTIATGATIIGEIRDANWCLNCSDWDVLNFTGAGSGSYEYDIAFIEQIRKTGAGIWQFGASSSISTSVVDIEAGTLQLDGYVTADDVYIWDGATLAGDGQIQILPSAVPESVHNGGSISPGPADGGIGYLTIRDGTFYNYFCNDATRSCTAGNLNIELQDNGEGVDIDRISIINGFNAPTGTAVFGGEGIDGGTVMAIPLTTIPQGRYTFLHANNLVINSAPTLLETSALLDFTLGWDENDMWLDVAMARLTDIGGNRNDETIFDVIGLLADEGNPDAGDVLGEILGSDRPLELLGMLSPEQYPNLLDVSMAGFELYRSGVIGRMGNLHLTQGPRSPLYAERSNALIDGDPVLARLPAFRREAGNWSGWARVLGLSGNQEGDNGILGFEVDSTGLALGLDNRISENLVLGFGGGHTESDINFDNPGQDTDVDGYHLALYGSYSTPAWYLDVAALFAANDYDTVRTTPGGRATSSTDGDQWGLYVGGGYNLTKESGWYLIPTASAQWSRVEINGFSESGAGPFNLTVQGYDADSLVTTLGVRLGAMMDAGGVRIEPEVRLSWAHEFGDTDRDVQASFAMGGPTFSIEGVTPDRDSALIGAGLDVHAGGGLTLFVDYDGEFRGDFDAHMLSGGLRYNF